MNIKYIVQIESKTLSSQFSRYHLYYLALIKFRHYQPVYFTIKDNKYD